MASDKHHHWLLDLVKRPANASRCADCAAEDPEWASISLGVFVCITCSGIHRFLGTHISKVRSLRLDGWTDELCQFMEDNGNEKSNRLLECSVPVCYPRITKDSPSALREQYIRAKYERKEFTAMSALHFDTSGFPDKPIKTGVLQKRGKDKPKWAPRHFVLRNQLVYYKKDGDAKELGVIDLAKSKIFLATEKCGRPFVLQILELATDRSYFLQAENGKDFIDWLHALRTAKALVLGLNLAEITNAKELSDKIDVDIIAEGSMMKRAGSKGGQWQKRWFVLDRQYLLYFKDSQAAFPVGKVPLGSYAGGWDVTERESENEYQFALHTPYIDEASCARVYHFEAESKQAKAQWVQQIEGVIKSYGNQKTDTAMSRLSLYDRDS
eukprot:Unigene9597_Nuclearia_a/m.29332 Unigene9597_Nuclearia_a/g.29332  ORF Unigene9597_Nuclearia_a/g.29332 Unigene9597_Nuclearia_a/m.29332 type:complete len:383 (+) Unigene9597_Nuclearia_a:55-1203(+)